MPIALPTCSRRPGQRDQASNARRRQTSESRGQPIAQCASVATNRDRACPRGTLAIVERIGVYVSVGTLIGTRIWVAIGV